MIPDRHPAGRRRRRWDRVSWWYSLILVGAVIALAITLAVSGDDDDGGLIGVVRDAYTGKPVSDATISTTNATAQTNDDGGFRVVDPAATIVTVQKSNYESTQVPVNPDGSRLEITLRPTRIEGVVTNRRTGEPIPGAIVTVTASGGQSLTAVTDSEGRYAIDNVPANATITVSYDGYTVESKQLGQNVTLDFAITPDALVGTVTDTSGSPIPRAVVQVGQNSTLTNDDGSFRLGGVPEDGTIVIHRVGYAEAELPIPDNLRVEVQLSPFRVKAIYVSAHVAALEDLWAEKLAIADSTEVNAIVLDLKDSTGHVFYKTSVPLASQIGAVDEKFDPAVRLKEMKDRGIYTIARIVVFEDPILAEARPDLAIHDLATGRLWTTWNGLAWVNAHERDVWQYNIDLAVEAAKLGFDEIQLDYIRFPSDGLLENADYGDEFANETRLEAISGFLEQMQRAIAPTGAYLAIDIFGLTMWDDDDGGIGQNVVALEPYVDVICPMIYPSHFNPGDLGLDIPNNHPYEVILWSLSSGAEKIPHAKYKLRPWLQDFSYGEGIEYGDAEVLAQIQAADEFGSTGWMLWAPDNEYSVGGLAPQ